MTTRHFEVVKHRADGSFLVACSYLTGRLWDGRVWVFSSVEAFEQTPNLDMVATTTASGVCDALWLSGDAVLLSCDSGELEVWRCTEPGCMLELHSTLGSHDDMALSVGALADGGRVISAGADRRVIVWDVERQVQLKSFRAHSDAVLSVACHPSSKDRALSTSQDRVVRMWDFRQAKPASKFTSCSGAVQTSSVWCGNDENLIALGSETGCVEAFDLRGGACVASFPSHSKAVHRLSFLPSNSDLLVSASDDTDIKLHSLQNSTSVLVSGAHADHVRSLSWDPAQPSRLLSCGWDGCLLQHTVNGNPALSSSSSSGGCEVQDEPTQAEQQQPSDVAMETVKV